MQVVRASDSKVVAMSTEIKIGGAGGELAWSADSNLVGSVQKARFVFYRASDLATLRELPCQYPSSICFLPKDDLVVLGMWNSSALVRISDVLMGNVKVAGRKPSDPGSDEVDCSAVFQLLWTHDRQPGSNHLFMFSAGPAPMGY